MNPGEGSAFESSDTIKIDGSTFVWMENAFNPYIEFYTEGKIK